jgi:transglutaminase-like putative cysteine protease
MKSLLPVCCAGLLLCCLFPASALSQSDRAKFVAELKFEVTGDDVELVVLDVLLPQTEARRQNVASIEYSSAPKVVYEKDGQRYAQFRFVVFPSQLTIKFDVEVSRFDLATARLKPQPGKETPESLAQWLVHEKFLEKDALFVRNVASTISGNNRTALVQACFDHVVKNIQRSSHTEQDVGGLRSLFDKKGDCTEFSDAFITLCRAKGIPARNCTGYILGPTIDTAKHDWAEVYFDEYGWVPFDPHHAQAERTTTFNDLRPKYLAIERQRRNAVLNLHHFWSYNYVGNGKASVKDTFTTVSGGPAK